jgi:hypothetical protein
MRRGGRNNHSRGSSRRQNQQPPGIFHRGLLRVLLKFGNNFHDRFAVIGSYDSCVL